MKKKKILPNIEITELFLVKADGERTYVAEIRREKDEYCKPVICGCVVVEDGKIYCIGETLDEVSNYLDDICTMKLDMGMHSFSGVTSTICNTCFYLN
jgi:hypothetical protein